MERSLFASRLDEAAREVIEVGRRFVEESLPDPVRFRVELNASYDENLEPGERIFPEDRERYPAETIARVDLDTLVSLLWRDGAVPEWINLSVESVEAAATIVEVLVCGRFTADPALLYHQDEGLAPFHVLSPSIPPDEWLGDDGRFSLWWSVEARDRASFHRAAEHATKVRLMTARGVWCDDDSLAMVGSFRTLRRLALENTSVAGHGLAAVGGCDELEAISITQTMARPFDLAALASHARPRSVNIEGDATAIAGLEKLRGSHGLGSLSVARTALTDAELDHLGRVPGLRVLILGGVAAGSSVSRTGLSRLARARPDLRIYADEWP